MEAQKTVFADTPAGVSVKSDEFVKKEWTQPMLCSLNIQGTQAAEGQFVDNFELGSNTPPS